jgi:hypothetical protein
MLYGQIILKKGGCSARLVIVLLDLGISVKFLRNCFLLIKEEIGRPLF